MMTPQMLSTMQQFEHLGLQNSGPGSFMLRMEKK